MRIELKSSRKTEASRAATSICATRRTRETGQGSDDAVGRHLANEAVSKIRHKDVAGRVDRHRLGPVEASRRTGTINASIRKRLAGERGDLPVRRHLANCITIGIGNV